MIYLLEDDDSIRKLVIYVLESQGYQTVGFENPCQFWQRMAEARPDLVLLDLMLPEEDGISILRKIRSRTETAHLPVIILTARNAEFDRVEGLDSGADDYISKPFGTMELAARVRAVLRRAESAAVQAEFRAGPLYFCPERREVRVEGREVNLTYKEFQLLHLLVSNPGRVMAREVLMDRVWDLGAERENRTLDVHIRMLRAKLGSAGSLIRTVRGVGYQFLEESK